MFSKPRVKLSRSIVLLPFFPAVLLVTNSYRLINTLYHSKVLLNGRWGSYSSYRPLNGINNLFYWTQAINLDRYGRSGVTNSVGTGNYQLGNWWHLSLTSIYLNRCLGASFPVLAMFCWITSFLIWTSNPIISFNWLLISLGVTLISSYYYAASFVFLNYNAFGWIFFPLGLFGLLTGNLAISSGAWLFASFGSITSVLIAACICLASSINQESILPVCTLLPSFLKILTHFSFVENKATSVMKMASAIGLNRASSQKVKYQYPAHRSLFSASSIYFLSSWSLFSARLYFLNSHMPFVFILTVLILWVINVRFSRFADPQSLYMAAFSVGLSSLVLNPDIYLLLFFWISVSPLPCLIGSASYSDNLLNPVSYKPFNISPLINKINDFLKPCSADDRVLLALDNPRGLYFNLFDGYRIIHELLYFSASKNSFLVFPDWWAVFENNSTDSPEFWGREPEQVKKNMINWLSNYAIIYQNHSSDLDPKWSSNGFSLVAEFDWNLISTDVLPCRESLWGSLRTPKWFLLKCDVFSD